jgi:hypothetical protein
VNAILGRTAAVDVVDPLSGEVLVGQGETWKKTMSAIERAGVDPF